MVLISRERAALKAFRENPTVYGEYQEQHSAVVKRASALADDGSEQCGDCGEPVGAKDSFCKNCGEVIAHRAKRKTAV